MMNSTIIVGITGASGAIYGVRLIKALLAAGRTIKVIITDAGKGVMAHETGFDVNESFIDYLEASGIEPQIPSQVEVFSQYQMATEPASGSSLHAGMVICPCSMKTLAAVASGFADNLLTRAADVCLKEKRPLIVVPRETPFNLIHLKNMETIAKAGGVILPPNPSFYSFPKSIEELVDTVVARILDHLGVEHELMPRWGE